MRNRVKANLVSFYQLLRRSDNSIKYHKAIRNYNVKKTISGNFKNEIKEFWKRYDLRVSTKWHQTYIEYNEITSVKYISEPLYYNLIEPKLNDFTKVEAYSDKNNYYKFLPTATFPQPIIKNINGIFFKNENSQISQSDAGNYLKTQIGRMIIKPSIDSGGGRNVREIIVKDGFIYMEDNLIDFKDLDLLYKENYIIQKMISQNSSINEIYSKSLNTLRLMTVRIGDEIVCVSSVIRFGNNDSIVDNIKANDGVACGINKEGKLNDYGFTSRGTKMHSHPYSGIKFKDIKIPEFKSIENEMKRLHKELPYFDIVSWDVALNNKSEIIVVELNLSGQEINFHQFNNGPLFGKYTDAIMKKVVK